MRNILVIGHSHVGAIRSAAIRRRETGTGNSRVRTIAVQDPRFGDPTGQLFTHLHMPPALKAEVKRQIAMHRPLFASALNGNMHTTISLVREEKPFDFELSGEPSPPLAPDARIIPEAEIHARLLDLMQVDLRRLTKLRREIGPFWQIESPPPVAARSFIERRIEPFFTALPGYTRHGISPGGLRFRMWRLSCRITEAHCRGLGCGYIPTPRAVLDQSGFLAQAFAADSTHANIEFGEQVIGALEQLAARPRWVGRLGLLRTLWRNGHGLRAPA